MGTVLQATPLLAPGQRLTREEFLRRWYLMPELKRAELIGGVVYTASPVGLGHAFEDSLVGGWSFTYAAATPGSRSLNNATWRMLGDSPQPDICLALLPAYGGRWRVGEGDIAEGIPELAVEIAVSSSRRDLGPRRRLYEEAGVPEYIVVLVKHPRVLWLRLADGEYREIKPSAGGVLRSEVFPGLWLDPKALLAGDQARLLAVLTQGLESSEHRAFLAELSRRKKLGR